MSIPKGLTTENKSNRLLNDVYIYNFIFNCYCQSDIR